MTKLWIASDFHQEFPGNHALPQVPRDVDVIVVAGDATAPLSDALAWLRTTFGDRPIVYVPGNHDFYQHHRDGGDGRMTMDEILTVGRDAAERYGIHLLSDDAVTIAGVRFLGTTLWTDYRVEGTPIQAAMRAAEKGMNDYKNIRRPSSTKPTKPIRAADLLARHRASVEFLDAELALPFDGPTVVVTHHAPHRRSLMVQFDPLNGCYASDLEWLIRKHSPPLWVHGHTHVPSDYDVGNTRIVCNPRGYPGEVCNRRWDHVTVEV
ncbi:metallophosphoesterase family protein [Lichenifustis flavocetrariae]|uniref:Metallophosphoesterase family protein n=1 Tax=Lichenifustis flavocetrariae TaxID=2949735 RepID=A0AA41YTK0_9HYPH|nr:metallophosphoesterase [Lichenifustis flavocetrariae]MCW6507065.1 metallophosphoesterase family protein [Lichenifustis flavocetrariae]